VIGEWFWKIADPLLLRLRSRLEHLDDVRPSTRREDALRQAGAIAPTVRLLPEGSLSNLAARDRLAIGDYTNVRGEVRVLTPDASIRIGRDCYIGPQTRIWAADGITIGDYVLIAHGVDILDHDSHSLRADQRREEARDLFERRVEIDFTHVSMRRIVIEDDVWIGAKSTILKGVHIGRGAIVSAGTMVTKDVEAFTLVAGNPMRVVRQLEP